MGISSSLFIGRSALNAYQSAMSVVGNNLANAATPGYARLSPGLASIAGNQTTAGQIGLGVMLASVRRNVNEALETRLRSANSDQQSANAVRTAFTRMEGVLDPLGDSDLGSLMSQFFNSVGALQNTPENAAARGAMITSAQSLAVKIREQRGELQDVRTELNRQTEQIIRDADQIATQIAGLNTQIATSEAGSNGQAGGLRDQRDQLLTQLAQYFNVTTREQPNGSVNVYLGSELLVSAGESRGLYASQEADANGRLVTVARFKLDNGIVKPTSGQVAGLATARDTRVGGLLDRLDSLAKALIQEVNKIHASGQGLDGFSTLTGLTNVTDPSQALSAANNGLELIPKTGSFFIDVKDSATGTVERFQIHIDLDGIGADTSLNSLAADISANTPLTATIGADGRLLINAPAGSTFTFADDTSNVLAGLGVNVFFSGKDSADIDVNSAIVGNSRLLAAGRTGQAGDGSNATAISLLQNQAVAGLGGISLNDHYQATVADLAVQSSAAQSSLDARSVVLDSLTAQRESVSGVNVDEEAVSMIRYQRAYEGAARYMTVVDSMLQTLLSLIR